MPERVMPAAAMAVAAEGETKKMHTSADHFHDALRITLFSPAGAVQERQKIRTAARALKDAGCVVTIDQDAALRRTRFAGTDEERVAAFERVATDPQAQVLLATRGGYGMTRLLGQLDYKKLAAAGKKWVGMSDFTAFSLAMLARLGASKEAITYSGPLATDQLAREPVDEVTMGCFLEAMRGELEAVGFRTGAPLADGLDVKGTLWGGNLAMVASLLGTPYMPRIKGGILFLEDVGEHPYRIERMLLQLLQSGVLASQKAILLGSFTAFKPQPNDRGYRLKTAIEYVAAQCGVPVLTGLPVGHVATIVTLPVGAKTRLMVEGREAFLVF
jgi:muramoyltetrapeptide carboxypeptidase